MAFSDEQTVKDSKSYSYLNLVPFGEAGRPNQLKEVDGNLNDSFL
jgi:hypothetical protein